MGTEYPVQPGADVSSAAALAAAPVFASVRWAQLVMPRVERVVDARRGTQGKKVHCVWLRNQRSD